MGSLQGQFLIAMPAMGDPNFHETVTFICKHDDEGAVGIVINRPSEMTVREVFDQLALESDTAADADLPVMNGGPVQTDLGFVLHQSDAVYEATIDPDAEIKVTRSQDILRDMAGGKGPKPAVIALGYAGWGSGQLEAELSANAWLSAPADPAILFDTPVEQRWQAAAALLGVDIRQVTNYAGHA